MGQDDLAIATSKILEDHFASEFECLPRAAIDQLLSGRDVELQRVKSASQIDLSSAMLIIKTAIDVCKFAYDVYTDQRDESTRKQKISQNIKEKYPQITEILADNELNSLISDLAAIKA